MERNNKMEIKSLALLCIMLLTLQSCTEIKVTEKEMAGVWIASDGAKLVLNNDSTFTLAGFNSWFWRIEATGKPVYKVSGKGKWKIETKWERPFVTLFFSEIRDEPMQDLKRFQKARIEFSLDIIGSNSPFYNKPPWIIKIYQCEDCTESYEFHRKE